MSLWNDDTPEVEHDEDQETCEACGLPVCGEGRYTADDVFLCGPCYDEIPVAAPRPQPTKS